MNYLPVQIAHTLFGNMNSNMQIRVRAEAAGHYCFINYVNPTRNFGRSISVGEFAELMDFRRIKDVRIYTDYDMRNGVGKEENTSSPDVHIDYVYLPGNVLRVVTVDMYMMDWHIRKSSIVQIIHLPYQMSLQTIVVLCIGIPMPNLIQMGIVPNVFMVKVRDAA